jgi:hypothetical protein
MICDWLLDDAMSVIAFVEWFVCEVQERNQEDVFACISSDDSNPL